jgi:undecaprenyl-diphosphatase
VNSIDASLYRAVNRFADRTSWAHGLAVADAKYGIALFALLLLAGWWRARATGDTDAIAAVLWAAAGCLVALGLNQILGHAFGRARPYASMPDVHVLIPRTSDFSFPSDHAVAVGAVAAGLWLADRALGWVAVVLALLLAAARVYVGAHYPGDVLAGLFVGAFVIVAGGLAALPLLRALVHRLDRSPLHPLVRADGTVTGASRLPR